MFLPSQSRHFGKFAARKRNKLIFGRALFRLSLAHAEGYAHQVFVK